jgi:hypothetical protein
MATETRTNQPTIDDLARALVESFEAHMILKYPDLFPPPPPEVPPGKILLRVRHEKEPIQPGCIV